MTVWGNTHCGICNQEICNKDGDALKGFVLQSCSCNAIFCYPDCLRVHQKSWGHKT
jgi:hypothetical protein